MSYTCLTPIFAHGRKLPCGKCGNCVRKRSLEWSFRLKCESRNWDTTSFITLTYNEDKFDPIITLEEAKELFKLWRGDRWEIKEVFKCEGFERLREFLRDIDVTDIHINVH